MNRYFAWFGLPGTVVLTALMSLTALTLAIVFSSPNRWLRFAAMLLGSLGDLILMNDPHVSALLPSFLRSFTAGGVVFLLSHFVYAAAFYCLLRSKGCQIVNAGLWCGAAAALGVILSLVVLYLAGGKHDPVMLVLSCVYMAGIGSVLTLVCSYAAAKGGWGWLLVLGSLSFIISDYFIVLRKLTPYATATTDELIWWFYPIGQLLLIVPVL